MHFTALKYIRKGLIGKRHTYNFVLGVPGGMPGEIQNLLFLLSELPEESHWSVAGIGRFQLSLAVHSILLGGHVRVGIEDNIYYTKGVLANSNAELISRITRLAKELNRPIASFADTKKLLQLP